MTIIVIIIIMAITIQMLIINRAFSIWTVIILRNCGFFSLKVSERNKCDALERSGWHNLTDLTIFDTQIIDFLVVS